MRRIDAAFLAAVSMFLVAFCLLGLFHYDYSATLLRFPLLAASVTLVLVACRLVLLRKGEGRGEEGSVAPSQTVLIEALGAARRRNAAISSLWVFSIVPLVFALGWPIGLAVYLLCALRHFGEAWPLSILIAASSLAISYGLFIAVLGVPLPMFPVWWSLVGG